MSASILLVFQILAHASLLCSLQWFGVIDWVTAFTIYAVMAGLGLGITYHRQLSHGHCSLPCWVHNLGMIVGVWGLIGSPMTWVAMHRQCHHNCTKSSVLVRWWLAMLEPHDIGRAADISRNRLAYFLHHYYEVFHVAVLLAFLTLFGLKATMIWYLTPAALLWNTMACVNLACPKFHNRSVIA